MKKYLFYWIVALMSTMTLSLVACGSDDDDQDEPVSGANSELVGRWDVVKTTFKHYTTIPEAQDYYNREEVEDGDGEYWEFSATKVKVHDDQDLANGKPFNYSYDKKNGELEIAGWFTYKVQKLTSSQMILFVDITDGKYGYTTTIEFTKH